MLLGCVVPIDPVNVWCRGQEPRPATVTSLVDTSGIAVLIMLHSAEEKQKVDIHLINYNIKLNLTICPVTWE